MFLCFLSDTPKKLRLYPRSLSRPELRGIGAIRAVVKGNGDPFLLFLCHIADTLHRLLRVLPHTSQTDRRNQKDLPDQFPPSCFLFHSIRHSPFLSCKCIPKKRQIEPGVLAPLPALRVPDGSLLFLFLLSDAVAKCTDLLSQSQVFSMGIGQKSCFVQLKLSIFIHVPAAYLHTRHIR